MTLCCQCVVLASQFTGAGYYCVVVCLFMKEMKGRGKEGWREGIQSTKLLLHYHHHHLFDTDRMRMMEALYYRHMPRSLVCVS